MHRLPDALRFLTRPALAAALLAAALAGACSKSDPLAPMAALARSGVAEAEARVQKAHDFLKDQVLPHPEVMGLFEGKPAVAPEKSEITWGSTPYIAVGAFDAQGQQIAALPRAADALDDLLAQAAKGPEVGDLMVIPNTFAFTLPMRQPVPGHPGANLSALLDVDRVLVQGVLNPVAEAAHGFAFLADGRHDVVLTTLPALTGRALSHWKIPVPEAGRDATATVTIGGRAYDVATATAQGGNGWTLGIGVEAAPGTEKAPAPVSGPPGATGGS
jgi:hypothetical protein